MRRAAYLTLYLLLVVAVAVAFGSGSVRIGDDPETSIPWGDRVIETPEELSSWLAARGVTYEEWARKHPDAALQIETGAPPAYLALQWPPTIRGEIPLSPAAVRDRFLHTVEGRPGGTLAAAFAAAMLAAAFMLRRRLAHGVATLPLLVSASLRGPIRHPDATAALVGPPGVAPARSAAARSSARLAQMAAAAPRAANAGRAGIAAAAREARSSGAVVRDRTHAARSALGRRLPTRASAAAPLNRAVLARRARKEVVRVNVAAGALARNGDSVPPVMAEELSPIAAMVSPTITAPRDSLPAVAALPEPAPSPLVEPYATPPRAETPRLPAHVAPAPPLVVDEPASEGVVALDRCEIRVWHGYLKSQFFAVTLDDGQTLALSPAFKKSGDVPAATAVARAAFEALAARLVDSGWEHDGDGAEWYQRRFRLAP